MSATGKPSSSSLPSRYNRVRAWHRVGLTWQMLDAATSSGSWPCRVCPAAGRAPSTPLPAPAVPRPERCVPAAFAGPDGGGVIVFSSLQPGLKTPGWQNKPPRAVAVTTPYRFVPTMPGKPRTGHRGRGLNMGPKIAVIGGGIARLTTAGALARPGPAAVVYEQAPVL